MSSKLWGLPQKFNRSLTDLDETQVCILLRRGLCADFVDRSSRLATEQTIQEITQTNTNRA